MNQLPSLAPLALAVTCSLVGCVTDDAALGSAEQRVAGGAIVLPGGGTGQSQQVMTDFEAPLVVLVVDTFGQPIEGATVRFDAPADGATAFVADAPPTDRDGLTSVDVMAGPLAGTYTIDASVHGASAVSFVLRNRAGAPRAVVPVDGTAQQASVGRAFARPLAVRVTDTYGNPVAGTPVEFAAPTSGATAQLSAAVAMTDTDGLATVTATAGDVAGTYMVGAQLGNVGSIAFVLSNVAAVTPIDRPWIGIDGNAQRSR
ncbi:MAG TPA: Ig-like domain-containing protein [Kofleriaceae bacterium]|nr:Ig-like domain-containing protein [Kofleriaceae bacterium]